MRNLHVSSPLFTDVHGPRLHEGTSKNEDLFESLTESVSVCTIKICAGVNINPMDQTLKKWKKYKLSLFMGVTNWELD